MLKVEIKDASVETRQVNGKTGVFTATSQSGWVHLESGELRKVRVRISADMKPYNVGVYALGDASFGVGLYGDLMIASVVLVPVSQKAA